MMWISTLLLPCAGLQIAARGMPRHASPRAEDIAVDVSFYRAAKTALRAALTEEGGLLSEDAIAMVEALAAVNPTRPDPSEDFDLWSGKFELSSSSLSLAGMVQEAVACISISKDDGALELAGTLRATDGSRLRVVLSGCIEPTGDATLKLDRPALRLQGFEGTDGAGAAAMVAAVGAELALTFAEVDDAELEWTADTTLPDMSLSQLYLDQDLHILEYSLAESGTSAGSVYDDVSGDYTWNANGGRLAVLFKS